jgi:hypothetical protein
MNFIGPPKGKTYEIHFKINLQRKKNLSTAVSSAEMYILKKDKKEKL